MKAIASRNIIILICLISMPFLVLGQTGFSFKYDVPVSTNDAQIKYPWVGGLDNPQFSEADLNDDDIPDLVIFDRKDGRVLTFISDGSEYTFDPYFAQTFPDINGFCLLRDYNCDGIEDLFYSYILGIRLMQGLYSSEGRLKFIPVHDVLLDHSVNPAENIQVYEYDVPAISDINGDGMIDLLTFDVTGARVEYYENTGDDCSVFELTKQTDCWGRFYETMLDAEVLLNDTCSARLDAEMVHPGSTLTTLDMDTDGDVELLLGDITYNHINLLTNGGDADEAHIISQDINFPSNSLDIQQANFPATFYVDVTFDGINDLIVSPNQPNLSENVNCTWLYENQGQNDAPIFDFQRKNFLTSDMIDAGADAHPAFFDYDSDGDLDIVIGNHTYFRENAMTGQGEQPYGTLTLWKNIGDAYAPSFDLVTDDYAEISSLAGYGLNDFINLHPTFGDIDADGDMDMILGEQNGYIHLFLNSAPAGFPAFFTLTEYRYQDINIGKSSTPQLVDVDADGLLDLIIGEKNAILNFYHNTGSQSDAQFTLISNNWGGVDVQTNTGGTLDGYSVPFLIQLNDSSEPLLFVGSEKGQIYLYDDVIANAFSGVDFTLLNESILNPLSERISVAMADMDSDQKMDMLIGNISGGLFWLEQDTAAGPLVGIDEPQVDLIPLLNIFPNPTTDYLTIDWREAYDNMDYRLINVNGALLKEGKIRKGEQIELKKIYSGIYILQCNFRGKYYSYKILKTSGEF